MPDHFEICSVIRSKAANEISGFISISFKMRDVPGLAQQVPYVL